MDCKQNVQLNLDLELQTKIIKEEWALIDLQKLFNDVQV